MYGTCVGPSQQSDSDESDDDESKAVREAEVRVGLQVRSVARRVAQRCVRLFVCLSACVQPRQVHEVRRLLSGILLAATDELMKKASLEVVQEDERRAAARKRAGVCARVCVRVCVCVHYAPLLTLVGVT